MNPVCLVIGAGAGIGGTVGARFAREGYHACLCRRSDEDGLNRLVEEIRKDGGSATGFLLNAVEPGSIEQRVADVEAEIGPIEVAIYNLGAQIGDRALQDTSPKAFETGWRLGTFGLFRLASVLFPLMVERGKGTLLVTSSTAALIWSHRSSILASCAGMSRSRMRSAGRAGTCQVSAKYCRMRSGRFVST